MNGKYSLFRKISNRYSWVPLRPVPVLGGQLWVGWFFEPFRKRMLARVGVRVRARKPAEWTGIRGHAPDCWQRQDFAPPPHDCKKYQILGSGQCFLRPFPVWVGEGPYLIQYSVHGPHPSKTIDLLRKCFTKPHSIHSYKIRKFRGKGPKFDFG